MNPMLMYVKVNKNNVCLVFFKGVRSFKRLNQCKVLKHIELIEEFKACPVSIGQALRGTIGQCPMVPLSDRTVLLVFMVFAKVRHFRPFSFAHNNVQYSSFLILL